MELNIIFLDIDGVLCLNRRMNQVCLENLKTIVDNTSARIVLSSSWKLFPKSRTQIETSFREIGIDPIIGWTGTHNKTIDDDILIRKWIAIDDMDLLKLDPKRMQDHFVLTSEEHGITKENVQEAIRLLSY
ncbi:unnamed protein product [Adineta ricciae]|uniref:FCP1 homology domain-containing protein n=1 Tax=Adineta ricciae TaxID=249248 RepID=A0A815AFZ7_ADIRI|nr:unnamed protein product [Adineta ricciae]